MAANHYYAQRQPARYFQPNPKQEFMKIAFDSNVWRRIAIPSDFDMEPLLASYEKIRQAVLDKRIEPILSETVFTVEAIRRNERQDFFSSHKSKIEIDISESKDEAIDTSLVIGPIKGIDFNELPTLKKYFDEAIKLGFKIVRLPRIAGLVNEDIEKHRYELEGAELSNYLDKVFEVVEKIESKGAGMFQIQSLGNQFDSLNWIAGLRKVPNKNKIIKAVSEWADGDSVAISISLGCDYFCTRDLARGAGSKSILSRTNLIWLQDEYGFQTISPEDLANLV